SERCHLRRCVLGYISCFYYSASDSFLIFFFFFLLHRDHRDLHSFPTRRSSDLHPGESDHHRREHDWRGELARRQPHVQGRPSCSDRKSTRLNSSHLGISYAVFCLKKKKNKKNVIKLPDHNDPIRCLHHTPPCII